MKLDTDLPADSVEFCPAPRFENILACGTYKLIEDIDDEHQPQATTSSRRRVGKCILMRVHDDLSDVSMEALQEVHMPAILDMKWAPSSNLLAIADSEGRISFQQLGEDLHEAQAIQVRPTDVLCLSLDWCNRHKPNDSCSLTVSSSDGSLVIIRPDSSGSLAESESWRAHDYEAWTVAWDYHCNENIVYSGGDDLKLKGWDLRQGTLVPTFVNKGFDAGVTSLQPHPHKENVLAVGSYDAKVRIIDTRKPSIPLDQIEVGGGAWRVKWHPSAARSTDLLVACMHDGFKVIRFPSSVIALDGTETGGTETGGSLNAEVIKRFDAHESLAYGVDWARGRGQSVEETLVASCSFYDHTLYIWKA